MKFKFLLLLPGIFFYCLYFQGVFAAGFEGPGGVKAITLAADIFSAEDDTPCELTGRILEKIRGRKNRYLFEDGSGRVVVEIKHRVFGAYTVTPQHLVRLIGEVDADDKYANEVEVDHLVIIGPAVQNNSPREYSGG